MTTAEILREKYNHALFLNLEQLAEVLHRTKDGLRMSLKEDGDLARKINPCKVKIGRRLLFRLSDVANVIDGTVNTHEK